MRKVSRCQRRPAAASASSTWVGVEHAHSPEQFDAVEKVTLALIGA
jgi:hypothetical protein